MANAPPPLVLANARIVDPANGRDSVGSLLVRDGRIAGLADTPEPPGAPGDAERIDCEGRMVCPGLVDIRVKTGEPGAEPKETLKSASRAAAAGGVTSIVVQPDTDPAIDDPSVVDFIMRRARDIGVIRVYPAGAATRDLEGKRIAEYGLMREAGAVYMTDADHVITDSLVFRRALAYARTFDVLVAHRPEDPWLASGAAAHEGEFAGRLGLPAAPPQAETIMLERDLALAGLTGGRLLVDQVSSGLSLEVLRRARAAGVRATATVSVNHLTFNELDIGDYRTFCKLSPPLRTEDDRTALLDGVLEGLIEVIVSAHAPAPAEDKRLPFDEAAPGAVGLQTLLPALVTLAHDRDGALLPLLAAVTCNPAKLLRLETGTLGLGAPADLVVCDLGAPLRIDADALLSKSKNSPFDGRRLQGRVDLTLVGGRTAHRGDTGGRYA